MGEKEKPPFPYVKENEDYQPLKQPSISQETKEELENPQLDEMIRLGD